MISQRYILTGHWPTVGALAKDLRQRTSSQGDASATAASSDVFVVASPYRVCPLGAHIDHQGGKVCGLALNMGVLLAYVHEGAGEAGRVTLTSANFGGEVSFKLDEVPPPETVGAEEANWGAFARGAALVLQQKGYALKKGLTGRIAATEVGIVSIYPGAHNLKIIRHPVHIPSTHDMHLKYVSRVNIVGLIMSDWTILRRHP